MKDLAWNEDFINKVVQGDCIKVMQQMPGNCVDMILTDPPYMISSQTRISRNSASKYKGKDIDLNFGEWDAQWKPEEDYLNWCKEWLKECVRILKPYRHLIFLFDRIKITSIWEYLETLNMKGRSPLSWIKSNPTPRGRKVDFMKAVETAFWFTKEAVKQDYFNWQLGQAKDYVIDSVPHNPRYHPTQKAEKPLKQWIEYLSKPQEIVFDPFAGSGTTLVVAKKLNRKFIGIEIDEYYGEIARKRLAEISERMF